MDTANYLYQILGHFLNNMESHVIRLEYLIQEQEDVWFKLVSNNFKSYLPDPKMTLDKQELEAIYGKIYNAFMVAVGYLEDFQITVITTLDAIYENKNLYIKKAQSENGWHEGRTIWNNLNGLIWILKFHLKTLRKIYTQMENEEIEFNIEYMEQQFYIHCKAMDELSSNFIFKMDEKLDHLIKTFKM